MPKQRQASYASPEQGGVKRLGLAAVEVKQTRHHQNHHQNEPRPSSQRTQLTAATVSANQLEEQQQKQKKKGVNKHRRSRPRGQQETKTSRRKQKKEARHQALLASVKKSLSAVEHDSSDLIVVQGTIDDQHCRDMLVDPGASSNFVRRDWALNHRLHMRELKSPLDVTLADGQFAGRLTGAVVVKSLRAQGSSAPCTLIVMDQLSHHVILGMPWLRRAGVTLGLDKDTTWNGKPLCGMKNEVEALVPYEVEFGVACAR